MSLNRVRQNLIAGIAILLTWGCSHSPVHDPEDVSATAKTPEKTPAVDLPHPESYDLKDLNALFQLSAAPAKAEGCFKTQEALLTKTKDIKEIRKGVREIVSDDPSVNHWCFYQEIRDLNSELLQTTSILKRQESVLKSYRILIPVARAFHTEFKDSRYLRWAIQNYRRISPNVFFRSVELTPKTTAELVMIETPFAGWKASAEGDSVLEKYGIKEVKAQPVPFEDSAALPKERVPAATPPPGDDLEESLLEPAEKTPTASAAKVDELEQELLQAPPPKSAEILDELEKELME